MLSRLIFVAVGVMASNTLAQEMVHKVKTELHQHRHAIPVLLNEHNEVGEDADQQIVVFGADEGIHEILATGVSVSTWMRQSMGYASQIVSKAYSNTYNAQLSSVLSKVYTRINSGRVTVNWPNRGREYKACNGRTLAFVKKSDRSNIYVCRGVINSSAYQFYEMAQILIHEYTHTLGFDNECDASIVEVQAMRASGVGLRFVNSYLSGCGIN